MRASIEGSSGRRGVLAALVATALSVTGCGSGETQPHRYGFVGTGFCRTLDMERFQDRLGTLLEVGGVQEYGEDGPAEQFRGLDSDVHTCQVVSHGRNEDGRSLAGASFMANFLIYESAQAARRDYDDVAASVTGEASEIEPGGEVDVEASTWAQTDGDYRVVLVDGNLMIDTLIRSFPGKPSVDEQVLPILAEFLQDAVDELRDLPVAEV